MYVEKLAEEVDAEARKHNMTVEQFLDFVFPEGIKRWNEEHKH